MISASPFRSNLLSRFLLAAAWGYVLTGIAAMLWLSPKVPYADGWRLLGKLASQPFNFWHADNGHREVLPNLVRLAELQLLGGNQWLQIAVGMALLVATFVVLLRAMRLPVADQLQVRTVICALALSLFWLGCQRTLLHGHETVHAYLITLCLAGGLVLLQRATQPALWGAIALGVIASFSFGTGIACFAAFAVALWLHRRGMHAWLSMSTAAALTAGAYLAGNTGAAQLQFAPMVQLKLLMRWLSAPFAYAAWPVLDTDVAAQVPTEPGRAVAVTLADTWERAFGAFETATWPWLGLGAGGVALFAVLLLRARREMRAPGITITGLALAGFGLACGVAITAARADYFTKLHPDQLLATRYVVWSTLFWGGLLLAAVGLAKRPRRIAVVVAMVALLLVPSQAWMAQLAKRMQAAASHGAAMAANGVADPGVDLGETVPSELIAALPSLRRKRATVHAWPEVQRLGSTLDPSADEPVTSSDWTITPVTDASGGPGAARVSFKSEADVRALLVVDSGGRIRGIALPDGTGPRLWLGWVRGETRDTAWRAARTTPQ